ncbi:hypothetical protein VI817_001010 [Penicillium citrinum]|nr:hypothetical protein VI817_001010 [Penicillium citrinum]
MGLYADGDCEFDLDAYLRKGNIGNNAFNRYLKEAQAAQCIFFWNVRFDAAHFFLGHEIAAAYYCDFRLINIRGSASPELLYTTT